MTKKLQSLAEITDPEGEYRQLYLTNSTDNVNIVQGALHKLGMGDRFEAIGAGDTALVIAPYFPDSPDSNNQIVIRLSTEREEPGFVQENPVTGRNVNIHRPQIPQVLQPIHVEKVRVGPVLNNYASTNMRIEILPRLKVLDGKDEGCGTALGRALRNEGYKVRDPKGQNIGILPNTGVPVLLDPGELEWVGDPSFIPAIWGKILQKYSWIMEEQTESRIYKKWDAYIQMAKSKAVKMTEESAIAQDSAHHRDRIDTARNPFPAHMRY